MTSNPQAIALDQIPSHSPWPARLLGITPFEKRRRTPDEVAREYDREKWGSVLNWLKTQSSVSKDDLLKYQGVTPDAHIAYARGDDIYYAVAREVMNEYNALLVKILSSTRQHDTLVELGCGLGDKLLEIASVQKPRLVIGGEYTQSGVECGRLLAKHWKTEAQFERFDYNDPATLSIVPQGALVYTSHSIEQIPELSSAFLEVLIQRRPTMVVHFEPCYEDQSMDSLVGLMRRRYTEINDYNRNLVGMLNKFAASGKIKILRHDKNVFSDTPFNPTSVIIWAPVFSE